MSNSSLLGGDDFVLFIIALLVGIIALVVTRKLLRVSFPYFFMGLLGLIIGLWIGSFLSTPFSNLPSNYGRWVPLIIDVFIAVAVLDLFLAQTKVVNNFFTNIFSRLNILKPTSGADIVVDTSVLIDGRIEAIANTGFILGKLIIPKFVLNELQGIADSEDPIKRAKGRRGFEVLSMLQKHNELKIEISGEELAGREPVDSRIIKVAQSRNAKIMTVDYNLNRVAQLQGTTVLNINELAAALKPALIPGENIAVKVIQKGKEKNQGVGYLPDGTMIVVEGGDKFVGEEIECEVVRIFQTVAGKMIFVAPKNPIRTYEKRKS